MKKPPTEWQEALAVRPLDRPTSTLDGIPAVVLDAGLVDAMGTAVVASLFPSLKAQHPWGDWDGALGRLAGRCHCRQLGGSRERLSRFETEDGGWPMASPLKAQSYKG